MQVHFLFLDAGSGGAGLPAAHPPPATQWPRRVAPAFAITQNPVWIGIGIPFGAALGIVFGRYLRRLDDNSPLVATIEIASPVGGLVPPGTFAHVGASGCAVTRG